jgi:hypothetical protein
MGYAARHKRRTMTAELKLPEKMRARLLSLYQAQQEAIARLPETNAYSGALVMAMDLFGLDPKERNGINLDTGVITPASSPALPEPTPIRPEVDAPAESEGG